LAATVASKLVHLLIQKQVEQVIIPTTLQFDAKNASNIYFAHINEVDEKSKPKFPPHQPINDEFLLHLVHFLTLEQLPTRILIARGHKYLPKNQNSTKIVVETLGASLISQGVNFSYDLESLKLLKPNKAAFITNTPGALIYV